MAKHGLAGFEKLAVIKKVLPHLAEDEQFISRFVDEAQVAIKLAHVNVAQVFEVGRVGDEYFLALEYVDGRDLRRTLSLLAQEKRRFPIDIALLIGRELANGLAYAHRRTAADGTSLGLVHCDISPPNIMVSFEGETKIIDFGIARSALRGTATDPKMGFGKFGYMAPEQLIRGGVVDHRTDVYAAGVVLFELLTGLRLYEPKEHTDYRALARAVAQGQHRVPSDIDRALAPCDAIITTALAPRQDDRFATAADLRDAIARLLATINPTVSTDQLSSVMRGLFATEMAQQRELQERIANTHLSDFREELNTQAVPTFSFALSESSVQPALPKRTADLTAAERPSRKGTGAGPGQQAPRPAGLARGATPAAGQARPSGSSSSRGAAAAGSSGAGGRAAAAPSGGAASSSGGAAASGRHQAPGARAQGAPSANAGRAPGARSSGGGRASGAAAALPASAPSAAASAVPSGAVSSGIPGAPSGAVAASASAATRRPASAKTGPSALAPAPAALAQPQAQAPGGRPADSASTLQAQAIRSQRSTMIVVAVSAAVAVGAIVFVLMRNYFYGEPAAKLVPVVQPIEEEPSPPQPPQEKPDAVPLKIIPSPGVAPGAAPGAAANPASNPASGAAPAAASGAVSGSGPGSAIGPTSEPASDTAAPASGSGAGSASTIPAVPLYPPPPVR